MHSAGVATTAPYFCRARRTENLCAKCSFLIQVIVRRVESAHTGGAATRWVTAVTQGSLRWFQNFIRSSFPWMADMAEIDVVLARP